MRRLPQLGTLHKGVCTGNFCCPVLVSTSALLDRDFIWISVQYMLRSAGVSLSSSCPSSLTSSVLLCDIDSQNRSTQERLAALCLSSWLSMLRVSSPKEVYHGLLSCALLHLQSKAAKQTVEGWDVCLCAHMEREWSENTMGWGSVPYREELDQIRVQRKCCLWLTERTKVNQFNQI